MTFEEALAQGGDLVAAWDDGDAGGDTLRLFSIGFAGAERLAMTLVPEREREAMTDMLIDNGIRVGATYEGSDLVWAFQSKGFSVWSSDGLVADADDEELRIFEGAFDTNDVSRVVSFSGLGEDAGLRGVQLAVGASIVVTLVAEPHEPAEWASALGHDLAMWFSVPHDDAVGDRSNALELALANVAHRVADRIEELPRRGGFALVTEPVGPVDEASEVAFVLGTSPFNADLRYVELVVSSRTRKRTLKTGRWIRKGTNERIAGFLRAPRTARVVLRKVREILRSQRISDYA